MLVRPGLSRCVYIASHQMGYAQIDADNGPLAKSQCWGFGKRETKRERKLKRYKVGERDKEEKEWLPSECVCVKDFLGEGSSKR